VQENGATTGFPDWPSSGETVSILYQPEAMRFRGMCVMTNTVPPVARGPGLALRARRGWPSLRPLR
jgi:hypothetical protein